MITLHIEPKTTPLTWNDFLSISPLNSIALDGYVNAPPMFQSKEEGGPRVNFDHHYGVNRLATRATCAQVLIAIRQGLFSTFLNDLTHKVHIYINDCDEDVCTSIYLLKHGRQAANVLNERINDLVNAEDALDSTAGAYPYPKTFKGLKQLAWVFQPYREFRISGDIDNKDSDEYGYIIDQVESRILQYVHGQAKEIELDFRYEILYQQNKFALIKEIGSHAKTGLLSDGFESYISVRQRPNGNYTYSIGKLAFGSLNIPAILCALNKEEQCCKEDCWGGGNIVGGSPRVNGSKLSPDKVFEIVKEFL